MNLEIPSFDDGDRIPEEFAFGIPSDEGHLELGPNRNPHVSWSELPEGTRSLALICHDPDVPSQPDDVNQEGRTVPASLPRVDFYHWVLVDIPPELGEIPAGADADGITAHGKSLGHTNHGRRGINDYTGWFADDPDMQGDYGGYDGPCPPWNDERLHHYVFTLYALDVDTLDVDGSFTGDDALAAMQGHILDRDEWTGTYTLNPDLIED